MAKRNKIGIEGSGVVGRVRYDIFSGDLEVDGRSITDKGRGGGGTDAADVLPLQMVKNEADQQGVRAGEFTVTPWGPDNLFPNQLRMLFENNLVPGLIDFKADMIFGTGYTLVNDRGKEGDFCQEREWLDSWDVFDYLLSQVTDFVVYQNTFGQVRGTDKKDGKVKDILHINAQECRIEINEEKERCGIVVGNFDDIAGDFVRYDQWDRYADIQAGKLSRPISMYQIKKPTSGFRYYNYPVYIGAVNSWIPVANKIPKMHAALLKNTMMALYHVKIPLESLAQLKAQNSWTDEDLKKWVDEKLEEIDNMVCGAENAGKTFYSYSATTEKGQKVEWEISMIDNKMKEMSESHLQLFNDCNQALTSAFQVPPSLASIQLGQKLSSGSEVLNSFNFYVKTRTPIARKIITDPINAALRINFPGTRARLVFRDVTLVHQDKDKTGIEDETAI